jgi:hypothetical protein
MVKRCMRGVLGGVREKDFGIGGFMMAKSRKRGFIKGG